MFNISKAQMSYLIDVFILSIAIFFILVWLFDTNDVMVSYLLSLIAANSIFKEVRRINT